MAAVIFGQLDNYLEMPLTLTITMTIGEWNRALAAPNKTTNPTDAGWNLESGIRRATEKLRETVREEFKLE